MPTDACVHFYQCHGCGALLKPSAGHCCVFCSYADSKCPPQQRPGGREGGFSGGSTATSTCCWRTWCCPGPLV